jgi:hypothetical protein
MIAQLLAAWDGLANPRRDQNSFSDVSLCQMPLCMHAGIAYLDPGNLESQLQAGAQAGYDLIWVLLWVIIMVSPLNFICCLVLLPTSFTLHAKHCKLLICYVLYYCSCMQLGDSAASNVHSGHEHVFVFAGVPHANPGCEAGSGDWHKHGAAVQVPVGMLHDAKAALLHDAHTFSDHLLADQ